MTDTDLTEALAELEALSETCTCMSGENGCSTCVETIGWDPEMECPSCPVHSGSNGERPKSNG